MKHTVLFPNEYYFYHTVNPIYRIANLKVIRKTEISNFQENYQSFHVHFNFLLLIIMMYGICFITSKLYWGEKLELI